MYAMEGSTVIPYQGKIPNLSSGVFIAAGARLAAI